MSENSKIEWTDATWNPVRGCTKVSPGCVHCYAETFAERFRGVPDHPFEFGFDLRLVPDKLGDPIRWSKPKKIFVNSMSDLFHESVPDEYIEKVCRVMLAANWHTYQILTKRADRMAALLQGKLRAAAKASHIWWGVSVENRKHGLPRIAKNREDLRRILDMVDSPANGLTLCSGALGSDMRNDVVAMVREFGAEKRIHFAHMRNIHVDRRGNFHETGHYSSDGSLDMAAIVRAYNDVGFDGYVRPDHGRNIWGEYGNPGYGLYDRALGATYLNGLWEATEKYGSV